jgi:hypothetical protein
MKSAGDNLMMVAVPKNAAGMSRKAALGEGWHDFMKKTGEIMKICVRCNLIMPVATVGGMRIKG